jgi:L-ascorbate metabolism protein UlaG (beta-lactamase superfamily)
MLTITYIGGPTALIEMRGFRLLTDPTFDPGGTEYPTPLYTLGKTESPAIPVEKVGRLDAVLLSHNHHFDNLDHAGRKMLSTAKTVLTTTAGADRLKGNAVGLGAWQTLNLTNSNGSTLSVTAAPARHGPVGGDRGPVTGFVLTAPDQTSDAVYISGDTVWFEGVEEVARRFKVTVIIPFMGAAIVPQVGPDHLTMTAEEGVRAARLFSHAIVVPVHVSGWRHFTEPQEVVSRTFAAAGLEHRLRWPQPGVPTQIGGTGR